jgi:rhodanese-related sulfurtransferase
MPKPNVPASVDAAGASRLQKKNAHMLDVRTPSEFASARIPGSVNIPLDQLPQQYDTLRETVNQPVVIICRSGVRAVHARNALRSVGIHDLTVLDGGILAWSAAGLPVEQDPQPPGIGQQLRDLVRRLTAKVPPSDREASDSAERV